MPFDYDAAHRAWHQRPFFNEPLTDSVNVCLASMSFLEKFAPGNRNWFITPPIHVSGPNYTLHWKSASAQLPAFLDGYTVLASIGSNDVAAHAFQDSLFRAAAMDTAAADLNSPDFSAFTFSPGYVHAQSHTSPWPDEILLQGQLEPHSVSLAPYDGQTIYLAFFHNSDDDFMLALDDILIVNGSSTSTNNPTIDDIRFVSYPNPVENWLNLLFRLRSSDRISVQLRDLNGKLLLQTPTQQLSPGEQQIRLDLSQLPTGAYNITLQTSTQTHTNLILRK